MASIKIKYKNEEYTYESGISLFDIADNFKSNYKNKIIVASLNNKLISLDKKITSDSIINFYDTSSSYGKKVYERGLCFLFVKAVKDILTCDVKILYSLDNHVYCEILSNNLISEVTIEKIKIRMKDIVKEKLKIEKINVSKEEAINYFNKINQKDKASSLKYISNSVISLYKLDNMLDYFYGVMPIDTSYITNFNLKYIEDGKVILSFPKTYLENEKIKYDNNVHFINKIKEQQSYLDNINIHSSSDLNNKISYNSYSNVIRSSEITQNIELIKVAEDIVKNKDIKLVLITGALASGKTIFSRKLSVYLESIGYNPILISMNDYLDDTKIYEDESQLGINNITDYNVTLINNKISNLLDYKEVSLKGYPNKVKMSDNSLILLEGIYTFNEEISEMIPSKNKYKLYIKPFTPLNIDNHNPFKEEDNRLLRFIVKNYLLKSISVSKSLMLWNNIIKHENNIDIKDANGVYNSSIVYELGVLKTYAQPILFSVSKEDENYDDALRLINLFRVILGIPSEDVPHDSVLREFIGKSCFKNL